MRAAEPWQIAGLALPRTRAQNSRVRPILLALALAAGEAFAQSMPPAFATLTLDYDTPADPSLQTTLEGIDTRLRAQHGIAAENTSAGVLDLQTGRLALIRPDRIDYAASVPKIGILLAWFDAHPDAATSLDLQTRHELGLMIKASDNAMASKFSQALGLQQIQRVLDAQGFYDAKRGGGLWMGKHYGRGGERIVDPVGGHSHAATVRQLVRFYLRLEQGKLVSPAAARRMREIFASPDIPHRDDKFVKGLAGRGVILLRKAGWWETWFHDTAIVTGPNRHYIIVAMTRHPKGDDYLAAFAAAVDDAVMRPRVR